MLDEISTTKRVGMGSGTYVLRIKNEAKAMGLIGGEIVELTMRVLDRGGTENEE